MFNRLRREESDALGDLLEDVEGLQEIIVDLVERSRRGDENAQKLLASLRRSTNPIATLSGIPSSQYNPVKCDLPYHSHYVSYGGKVCKQNGHVFCSKHKLDKCIICGSVFK